MRFLSFFSGFPSHHFPPGIAERLKRELTQRDSLVFISAWPADYTRNDSDSDGMHNMFVEFGIPFAQHCVIDNRTEAPRAVRLVQNASCLFLMGGHPGYQLQLIRKKGLEAAIRGADSAVLGVSAGAINMAKHSLDTKESPVPYDGLGLADITVKPHFEPENQSVLSTLRQVSMDLPICAMEDDSAIFLTGNDISYLGKIHWIDKGSICSLSQKDLLIIPS